jgi:CheY-like chemotaxis protein
LRWWKRSAGNRDELIASINMHQLIDETLCRDNGLISQKPASTARQSEIDNAIIMTARILIIEDEFLVALDMQVGLEDAGHEVIGVGDDWKSAMRLAERGPTIALVDINLCDGATGPSIGAWLAKEIGCTVIFVIANPRQIDIPIPGALGVMIKPADSRQVVDAVEFALLAREGSSTPTPPPGLMLLSH